MAFVIVEFDQVSGGGVAIVNRSWLTPRKKEVFWPPVKQQALYEKALKNGDIPETSWDTYKVARYFFETDDYLLARKKLRTAEESSDLQSETEDLIPKKRKRICPRRLSYGSSSDDDLLNTCTLPRPPTVDQPISNSESYSSSKSSPATSTVTPLLSSETSGIGNTTTSSTSSNDRSSNEEFNKKLLSLMMFLKQQNEQILKLLTETMQRPKPSLTTAFDLPENIPESLPLASLDSVKRIEEYLVEKENFSALSTYLSFIGGHDVTSKTNTILKHLVTNQLASKFSFLGTRNDKEAFSKLTLCKLVLRAVQIVVPSCLEKDVHDAIKTWLKHSPQRAEKERNKDK